jgi:hypothetical protein
MYIKVVNFKVEPTRLDLQGARVAPHTLRCSSYAASEPQHYRVVPDLIASQNRFNDRSALPACRSAAPNAAMVVGQQQPGYMWLLQRCIEI